MSDDHTNAALDRALELVRYLRARCPWDARQTPSTLVPYLLEEAHETAEAIGAWDDAALEGELGDLLLNVAFQIVLAEERRAFHAEDVVRHLETKMRRRHPHLYGDGPAVPWEELKARERAAASDEPPSLLDGLPKGLDPLSGAQRIQDRVSAVGFDWGNARDALAKVTEEVAEVESAIEAGVPREIEEELGDLLFSVVNIARLTGGHAMRALQGANRKFTRRFVALEALARERGIDLDAASLEAMDALWDEVKRASRAGGAAGGGVSTGRDD
jgi:MazG family protein